MQSLLSCLFPSACLAFYSFFSSFFLSAQGIETVKFDPHTFSLPDGYNLKQVAPPPLVKRPIHMYFDVDGSLYVTDSSGNTDKAPKQLKNPALKGLVEPEGIVTIARGKSKRNVLDFNAQGHRPRVGGEQTIAEIISWERPEGGRVFHTGSIATAWAMYYDESLSNLVRNVLHHFKVKPKK